VLLARAAIPKLRFHPNWEVRRDTLYYAVLCAVLYFATVYTSRSSLPTMHACQVHKIQKATDSVPRRAARCDLIMHLPLAPLRDSVFLFFPVCGPTAYFALNQGRGAHKKRREGENTQNQETMVKSNRKRSIGADSDVQSNATRVTHTINKRKSHDPSRLGRRSLDGSLPTNGEDKENTEGLFGNLGKSFSSLLDSAVDIYKNVSGSVSSAQDVHQVDAYTPARNEKHSGITCDDQRRTGGLLRVPPSIKAPHSAPPKKSKEFIPRFTTPGKKNASVAMKDDSSVSQGDPWASVRASTSKSASKAEYAQSFTDSCTPSERSKARSKSTSKSSAALSSSSYASSAKKLKILRQHVLYGELNLDNFENYSSTARYNQVADFYNKVGKTDQAQNYFKAGLLQEKLTREEQCMREMAERLQSRRAHEIKRGVSTPAKGEGPAKTPKQRPDTLSDGTVRCGSGRVPDREVELVQPCAYAPPLDSIGTPRVLRAEKVKKSIYNPTNDLMYNY
jgi:hypothetical protein